MLSTNNILPRKGEAYYEASFFTKEYADLLFAKLIRQVKWKQESIRLFGRLVLQPRLIAYYGDEKINYSYSGVRHVPNKWIEPISDIKSEVEKKFKVKFNSALINLYRNGSDSMGWHRDNEASLGINPTIVSISFGIERKFQFRQWKEKDEKISVKLEHGSALLMKGETQHYWEHQIPKSKRIIDPRINITFRRII